MNRYNHFGETTKTEYIFRGLLVLVSVAILTTFVPRGGAAHYEYSIGKPWPGSPVIAKETFPLLKSDSLLAAERRAAQKSYKPIYEMDAEAVQAKTQAAAAALQSDNIPQDHRKYVCDKLRETYLGGILTTEDYETLRQADRQSITVSIGNEGSARSLATVYTPKTAYERIMHEADSTRLNRAILRRCDISKYIIPNLSYDKRRSESLMKSIEKSVSRYRGEIQAGQEIVHRGQIVDEYTYLALRSMETFDKSGQNKSEKERLSLTAGHALYIGLVILCLLFFFTRFRRDYLTSLRTVAFLLVMTLVFPLITYALAKHVSSAYIAFAVPYCIVPVFVRVFLDSRTAFIAHLSCVLLSALAVAYQFEFITVELTAGLVAIYSMRQLTQRSELFATVVYVTLMSLVCYLSFDLMAAAFHRTDGLSWEPYLLLLAAGLLLSVSYLLLLPFERLFRFTSNVTLVELSNTNTPLLRRLSEEAPGTFQHSMQVANLAAEVANKLGGNSQLARTGALYHDIGKLNNPAYFTENQSGANPHDRLPYADSARIIIAHVRDGLALARKHKLPPVICDFIATHHGRGKTKYFYVSYMKDHPNDPPRDELFSYPGPNPRTMEQAVLMMADAVEAAARSLREYTEQEINALVDRIVDSQVSEGLFGECSITFESISQAKRVFKEKLKSVYHTRINYPELGSKA